MASARSQDSHASATYDIDRLFGTNDRLTPGEEMSVTMYLNSLRPQIAHMDSQAEPMQAEKKLLEERLFLVSRDLRTLKGKSNVAKSDFNRYRTLLHPMRRLPSDILHYIFALCAAGWKDADLANVPLDSEWASWSAQYAPLRSDSLLVIEGVCKRWYDEVIGYSRLWSSIAIDVNDFSTPEDTKYLSYIETRVARSRALPLTISLQTGAEGTEEIPETLVEALSHLCNRTSSMSLGLSPSQLFSFLPTQCFRGLRILVVDVPAVSVPRPVVLPPAKVLFPALHTLTIRAAANGTYARQLLDFITTPLLEQVFIRFPLNAVYRTFMESLSGMLAHSGAMLKALDVQNGWIANDAFHAFAERAPSLVKLAIIGDTPLSELLDTLESQTEETYIFPCLHTLRLRGYIPNHDFYGLARRIDARWKDVPMRVVDIESKGTAANTELHLTNLRRSLAGFRNLTTNLGVY